MRRLTAAHEQHRAVPSIKEVQTEKSGFVSSGRGTMGYAINGHCLVKEELNIKMT